jgi:hypothetical protein
MVGDIPYEEALDWFMLTREKDFDEPHSGMTHYNIFDFLNVHNYTYQHHFSYRSGGVQDDPWPKKPFAESHILSVPVPTGAHFVAMDDKGVIYDPSGLNVDCSKPGYMIGIWKR